MALQKRRPASCRDILVNGQRDMMIVEKLYKSQKYPYHMILEKEKEKFFKFSAAPFRKITDRIFLPFHIFARLAGMGRKLQDTCTGLMV